jgi:hypothetical protein
MAVRIAARRSPFLADRNHFHHNLLALGLQTTESVLVIYAVQSLLVVSAFLFRFYSDGLLLGGYLVFSTLVISLFTVASRKGWRLREPTTELRDFFGSSYLRRMKIEAGRFRSGHHRPSLPDRAYACSQISPGAWRRAWCSGADLIAWRFRKDRLGTWSGDPVPADSVHRYESTTGRGGAALLVYRLSFSALRSSTSRCQLSSERTGSRAPLIPDHLPGRGGRTSEQNLRAYSMGLVAAKTIIFTSASVLMAEQRAGTNSWLRDGGGWCIDREGVDMIDTNRRERNHR